MRNILLTVALISCAAAPLNGAHVTACRSKDPDAKACLCTYLGYPPPDKRVKTDQRAEILADWKLQDSVDGDKGAKYLAAFYRGVDDSGQTTGASAPRNPGHT